MPTRLSLEQTFPASPDEVFDLFADREFQEGKVAAAGGEDPEVTDFTANGEGDERTVTVTSRQGIPHSVLPGIITSLLPGDPVVTRTERWRADGDGYVADFDVQISGAPASLTGSMSLRPGGDGTAFVIDGSAKVSVPLIGGRVETVIVEQVTRLMDIEHDYTVERLG